MNFFVVGINLFHIVINNWHDFHTKDFDIRKIVYWVFMFILINVSIIIL